MKNFLILLFIILANLTVAQRIGKFAEESKLTAFPPYAWGVNLMFGEGGFGLGTFYNWNISTNSTITAKFSISETTDEKEVKYIDYWGNVYVSGKKNRAFLIPLSINFKYRLFTNELTDT